MEPIKIPPQRDQKIASIYKEMANKNRTFGCICRRNDGEDIIFIRKNRKWEYLYMRRNNEFTIPLRYSPIVIWNPVMIGNVIEYIRIWCEVFIEWQPIEDSTVFWRWRDYKTLLNNLVSNWYRADLPIDKQTDECVDFVYSLIQKS